VQREREAGKGFLLLDSGDLFFDRYRKPLSQEDVTAQAEKALLILRCYNLLGYDALGIGDDDLSLGKEFLVGLSRSAGFPFLASNLLDQETGKPLFHTHVIRETGGWRIGIFSLLSPHFIAGGSDSSIRGIAFSDPLEEAKRIINTIRLQADLIVLLSHLGYTADLELAEAVPGIDVILSGHSERSLSYPICVRDTIIVRTGSKGLNVGKLHVRPAPDRSSRPDASLEAAIPLSHSEKEHPEIVEWVEAYKMRHTPGWFMTGEMCPEL